MPVFQLHASGLAMLNRCGVQFYNRYVQGIKLPPGVGAVVGTGVDRSVTANLAHRRDHGEPLPKEAVQDIARDAVAVAFEAGDVAKDGDFDDDESRDKSIDHAVSLAALHYVEVAPQVATDALQLQREWVLDVSGLAVQLAGTIDIQEGRKVRDTKTSKRVPAADEAHLSLQLTMYALAVRQIDGKVPESVQLDYLVKAKNPKVEIRASTRSDADFAHLLQRVARASQIIESGAFAPAPIDSWWCSAKWCGYHRVCPYARRPVSVTVPVEAQLKQSLITIGDSSETL